MMRQTHMMTVTTHVMSMTDIDSSTALGDRPYPKLLWSEPAHRPARRLLTRGGVPWFRISWRVEAKPGIRPSRTERFGRSAAIIELDPFHVGLHERTQRRPFHAGADHAPPPERPSRMGAAPRGRRTAQTETS